MSKWDPKGLWYLICSLLTTPFLFLENDKDNFLNALSIFQIFELSSKLKMDLSKSNLVGINVDSHDLSNKASLTGC